jgi:hypothetical protein
MFFQLAVSVSLILISISLFIIAGYIRKKS